MRDLILDLGERILVVLLFAGFLVANARSRDWADLLLVGLESIAVVFILARRRATSVSDRASDWVLAMGGTFAVLLARPESRHMAPDVARALIIVGSLVATIAKLSLNRRFGFAPANRGIQASWAYAVVRHPIYLGYTIAEIGYLLYNPSLRNLIVYTIATGLQLARIVREERLLMQDADYRAYAGRVRFRLVPGVY